MSLEAVYRFVCDEWFTVLLRYFLSFVFSNRWNPKRLQCHLKASTLLKYLCDVQMSDFHIECFSVNVLFFAAGFHSNIMVGLPAVFLSYFAAVIMLLLASARTQIKMIATLASLVLLRAMIDLQGSSSLWRVFPTVPPVALRRHLEPNWMCAVSECSCAFRTSTPEPMTHFKTCLPHRGAALPTTTSIMGVMLLEEYLKKENKQTL